MCSKSASEKARLGKNVQKNPQLVVDMDLHTARKTYLRDSKTSLAEERTLVLSLKTRRTPTERFVEMV